MFFNRFDIAFKGQHKWWESFDELVDQGDLNRDERENQQIVDVKEESTGNTDDSQEEGIDRFDKEDWSDSSNVIHHTTAFKKNFWNVIKVRVQKNNIGNLTGCWISLGHHDGAVCFAKSKDIIDPISCHSSRPTSCFQGLDKQFFLVRRHTPKDSCFFCLIH